MGKILIKNNTISDSQTNSEVPNTISNNLENKSYNADEFEQKTTTAPVQMVEGDFEQLSSEYNELMINTMPKSNTDSKTQFQYPQHQQINQQHQWFNQPKQQQQQINNNQQNSWPKQSVQKQQQRQYHQYEIKNKNQKINTNPQAIQNPMQASYSNYGTNLKSVNPVSYFNPLSELSTFLSTPNLNNKIDIKTSKKIDLLPIKIEKSLKTQRDEDLIKKSDNLITETNSNKPILSYDENSNVNVQENISEFEFNNSSIINHDNDKNYNTIENSVVLKLSNSSPTMTTTLQNEKIEATTQKATDWWKLNPLENPWQRNDSIKNQQQTDKINKLKKVENISTKNNNTESVATTMPLNCKSIKNKSEKECLTKSAKDEKIILHHLKEKYGQNAR